MHANPVSGMKYTHVIEKAGLSLTKTATIWKVNFKRNIFGRNDTRGKEAAQNKFRVSGWLFV